MRHEMRLQLSHEVHHDDNDDEQRGAAQIKRNAWVERPQNLREQTDCGDVRRADHRQTRQHRVDEARRVRILDVLRRE